MPVTKAISENLRFLCIEVDTQLGVLQTLLGNMDASLCRHIHDRGGYVYNLKTRIHNSALLEISQGIHSEPELKSLRASQVIASQLERISELCRECAKQAEQLDKPNRLQGDRYPDMLEGLQAGIALIEQALETSNSSAAQQIANQQAQLKKHYDKLHQSYIDALKQNRHIEDLTNALFIARNVKQMGDALQVISAAILSSRLGQAVNLAQYPSLEDSARQLGSGGSKTPLNVKTIAETRSGSAIAGVSATSNGDVMAIFKEGQKRKLKEERLGVESWHEIYPGLAPKILSYQKRGKSAALLIEHLPGLTFEQILLHESPELLDQALKQLGKTLKSVWQQTRTDKPAPADHIGQLQKRLDEVYAIHPEFQTGDSQICGLTIPAFDSLLDRAAKLETRLPPPFSVYIHGDFNVDNIIYDPEEQRINFIDLHRSRYLDYVQDVSVFMVSNYRLQILDAPRRQRILALALDFYQLASRFARKQDDHSFELRLALGLARSFATSTRFILDKSLARSMFHRARYLIELALAADPAKPADFTLPIKEIFVG